MFLVGLLPALVSFAIRRGMGEPEAFTKDSRVAQEISFTARLRMLFADRATSKASIGILILCSVQNFGYYGLMIWMPSYLSSSFGFSLTKSGLWTAVTVVGMTFGIWLFGVLADRFARWKIFLIYGGGRRDGHRLRPAAGPDPDAVYRSGNGDVCQRHDWRLWRADL